MRKYDEMYHELLKAFTQRHLNDEKRSKYVKDLSSKGAEKLDTYSRRVQEDDENINELLREFIRFPPQHARHFDIMKVFHENAACFENAVFIMTKFPQTNSTMPEDVRLNEIIQIVRTSLSTKGYHPRIASEPRPPYHNWLWDNVEAYLFCCGSGVAIVEDKYRAEFNPNVAMEWGWMRALDKKVLYLIDKDFKHVRADTQGLLAEDFSWEDPKPGIEVAIAKYFPMISP